LDQAPANGVVIAVITNTDYIYNGETTRKAHFDYRLRLVTGVTGTADVNTKWYNSATLSTARTSGAEAEGVPGIDWSKYCIHAYHNTKEVAEVKKIINPAAFLMYPNPVIMSNSLKLEFTNVKSEKTFITITDLKGERVFETVTTGNNYIFNTKGLTGGMYVVRIKNTNTDTTQKLIVQ
jgi:hypothetical protein